ncbi:MAG: hypothetical protein ACRCZI_11185 [Cetobacterium sp.]
MAAHASCDWLLVDGPGEGSVVTIFGDITNFDYYHDGGFYNYHRESFFDPQSGHLYALGVWGSVTDDAQVRRLIAKVKLKPDSSDKA